MIKCQRCGQINKEIKDICSSCGQAFLESLSDVVTLVDPEINQRVDKSRICTSDDTLSQSHVDSSLSDIPTLSGPKRDARESMHQEGLSLSDIKTISGDLYAGSVVIDRFEILSELGRGGMGVVYKAHDRNLNRTVALKSLLLDSDENHKAISRFRHEAETIASLNHFNIVQIYDILRKDQHDPLIVMEYVMGGSLAQKVGVDQVYSVEEVQEIGLQICDALSAAHERGIFHRDIKPDNILLTERGTPKLADFGLAYEVEASIELMTVAGAQMGTPFYAAPEQMISGSNVDARSDIYSLGATLYSLATGEIPRTIRAARIPEQLQEIILKCLEEHPDKRYRTAAELKKALQIEKIQVVVQSQDSSGQAEVALKCGIQAIKQGRSAVSILREAYKLDNQSASSIALALGVALLSEKSIGRMTHSQVHEAEGALSQALMDPETCAAAAKTLGALRHCFYLDHSMKQPKPDFEELKRIEQAASPLSSEQNELLIKIMACEYFEIDWLS